MKTASSVTLLLLVHQSAAFAPQISRHGSTSISLNAKSDMSRQDFMSAATTMGVSGSMFFLPPNPAYARGRATLEQAIDRYYPRLETGGVFYSNDLKKAIEKNDWAAIKVCNLILQSGFTWDIFILTENMTLFRTHRLGNIFRLRLRNHRKEPKRINQKLMGVFLKEQLKLEGFPSQEL